MEHKRTQKSGENKNIGEEEVGKFRHLGSHQITTERKILKYIKRRIAQRKQTFDQGEKLKEPRKHATSKSITTGNQ